MRLRNGFTLVETLVVVVLLGLVALMAFPQVSSALIRSDLRSARTTMINLVATARAVSVQSNRLAWIKFEGNRAHVLARPRVNPVGGAGINPPDTVGPVRDLGAVYKVAVASDADSIQFDPRGFGTYVGADVDITLTRGSYTSTITIDGLGRVRK